MESRRGGCRAALGTHRGQLSERPLQLLQLQLGRTACRQMVFLELAPVRKKTRGNAHDSLSKSRQVSEVSAPHPRQPRRRRRPARPASDAPSRRQHAADGTAVLGRWRRECGTFLSLPFAAFPRHHKYVVYSAFRSLTTAHCDRTGVKRTTHLIRRAELTVRRLHCRHHLRVRRLREQVDEAGHDKRAAAAGALGKGLVSLGRS